MPICATRSLLRPYRHISVGQRHECLVWTFPVVSDAVQAYGLAGLSTPEGFSIATPTSQKPFTAVLLCACACFRTLGAFRLTITGLRRSQLESIPSSQYPAFTSHPKHVDYTVFTWVFDSMIRSWALCRQVSNLYLPSLSMGFCARPPILTIPYELRHTITPETHKTHLKEGSQCQSSTTAKNSVIDIAKNVNAVEPSSSLLSFSDLQTAQNIP